MSELARNESENRADVSPKYETRDVNIRAIWRVGVALLIFVVVAQVLVVLFQDSLIRQADEAQPRISPLVQRERVRLPQDLAKIPAPRLQIAETLDLARLREREDKKLRSIDQAIQLLADPKSAARYGVMSAKGSK